MNKILSITLLRLISQEVRTCIDHCKNGYLRGGIYIVYIWTYLEKRVCSRKRLSKSVQRDH